VAVESDDVELAEAGAGVALEDHPAALDEPGGDKVLGGAADPLSLHGHLGRR
jgi:NACalpha-BTF3-like transcription factor